MAASLFLMSFTVIYLQVALMRLLNHAFYGTFTSLVISLALLGFGAGGTFLALNRRRIEGRENRWLAVFAGLTASGVIVSILAVVHIPLNLAYLPYNPGESFRFILIVLAMLPAFLGGGSFIGLVLISSHRRRGRIYGLNLLGSGAGGLAAFGVMYVRPPVQLPILALIPVAGALILTGSKTKILGKFLTGMLAVGCLVLSGVWKPPDRIDQYKDLAGIRRLEAQGGARLIAAVDSPQGRIEAYASPSFHYFLFAGLEDTASLPEQIAIFRDGNLIGAPFADADEEESSILDRSLPALAYRLTDPQRVLIIGDAGLNGVRTAIRSGAREVTLVLPDRRLKLFLENELGFAAGNILGHPSVTVVAADYRRYMLDHPSTFDIIHMAAAESMAVPSSGFGSTQDDYLLTVESMSSAIKSLTSGGILTISRGIQTPPRDNLKLFLTLSEALRAVGIEEPENQLLLVRGYLAASNMAFRDPPEANRLEAIRNLCRDWALDIEYEPGAGEAPPGYYGFQLPGPEGSGDTWLRHTARLAAEGRTKDLIRSWVFDIRPSTDRRPFFHSFFRWRSLDRFTEYYGRYWFRRSDLGSLILVISLASTALLSFLLVLLPHITGRARLGTGFLAYFPAVGMGYFFLEIVMIRRAALFLGDPHSSVPIVLAAILTSSGAGSLIQERLEWSLVKKTSVALAFLTASLLLFFLPASTMLPWISALDKFGGVFPYLFAITAAGIPAFFMGWFFAPGLDTLARRHPEALPTAWALNGFASVVSSPLAVLTAMNLGYLGTAAAAIGVYGIAFLLAVGNGKN